MAAKLPLSWFNFSTVFKTYVVKSHAKTHVAKSHADHPALGNREFS